MTVDSKDKFKYGRFNVDALKWDCQLCKSSFCRDCKMYWHPGKACEFDEKNEL